MFKFKLWFLAVSISVVLLTPATLSAGAISADAGWYGFCFSGVGNTVYVGCKNEGIGVTGNPVTFAATGEVELKITDAFSPGDMFQVVIDGGTPLNTSTPSGGAGFTVDPDAAFADPAFSHIGVLLGSGSHTVDVSVIASPFGAGGAYLEVVSAEATPEPAALSLMGGGLLLLGLLRRRRA
jgi:hypothetical protein